MNIYQAKFIRKVTTVTAPRKKGKYNIDKAEDGRFYHFVPYSAPEYDVGDRVMLAKLRSTYRSTPFVWDVYEIELPVYKWMHQSAHNLCIPQTWFEGDRHFIYPGKPSREIRNWLTK